MNYKSVEDLIGAYKYVASEFVGRLDDDTSFRDLLKHYDSECSHDFVFTKRELSNGVIRVARQCRICGHGNMNGIKKLDHPKFHSYPYFNDEFKESIRNEIGNITNAAYEGKRLRREDDYKKSKDKESRAWWDKYTKYLKTESWQVKRTAVLKRDPICKACESRQSEQVHHLTYKHVGNEPLFDLVGVCTRCHDKITEMDRRDN